MKLKTGVVGLGPRGLFFCTMIDDDPEMELAEVMAAEKTGFGTISCSAAGRMERHWPMGLPEETRLRWRWPLRRVSRLDRR